MSPCSGMVTQLFDTQKHCYIWKFLKVITNNKNMNNYKKD